MTAKFPLGTRLSTGFINIDISFGGGLPTGTFLGVYGTPRAGTSTLLMQFALQMAGFCRVCFIDLQRTMDESSQRFQDLALNGRPQQPAQHADPCDDQPTFEVRAGKGEFHLVGMPLLRVVVPAPAEPMGRVVEEATEASDAVFIDGLDELYDALDGFGGDRLRQLARAHACLVAAAGKLKRSAGDCWPELGDRMSTRLACDFVMTMGPWERSDDPPQRYGCDGDTVLMAYEDREGNRISYGPPLALFGCEPWFFDEMWDDTDSTWVDAGAGSYAEWQRADSLVKREQKERMHAECARRERAEELLGPFVDPDTWAFEDGWPIAKPQLERLAESLVQMRGELALPSPDIGVSPWDVLYLLKLERPELVFVRDISEFHWHRDGRASMRAEYLDMQEASYVLLSMTAVVDGLVARVREMAPNDGYAEIHDWLAEQVEYVAAPACESGDDEACGPILHGRGTADGIVRAFAYIAHEAGLACHPTYGRAGGERHPWVVVPFDAEGPVKGELWRHMDVAEDVRLSEPGNPCRKYYAMTDDEAAARLEMVDELPNSCRHACPEQAVRCFVTANEVARLRRDAPKHIDGLFRRRFGGALSAKDVFSEVKAP